MVKVKDILAKKGNFVAPIGKNNTVLEAAMEMNARRIGALVVTEGKNVVGIVTERDILRRLVAAQRDPEKTTVGEIMSSPVACCRTETTLEECRGVMTNKRIRHIPVVEDNNLMGIITIGDLMAYEVEESQETILYLHEYIYGPYP